MASVVLNPAASKFPAGTTVKAYKRSNMPAVWDHTGAPAGSQDASATVATDGSVTFSGLADDTEYLLYAASPDRWASFRTAPSPAAQETVATVAASGAAVTLVDVDEATVHRVTLTANATLTFPPAAAGKRLTLVLVQDATGSRTVTWPAAVKWPAGTAPTLTVTAAKKDVFRFVCADGTNWLGEIVGQNYA